MGTFLTLFILAIVSIRSKAFVTQKLYSSASGRNIICQLSSSPPPSDSGEVWVRNKARTDIRNFLTQRSIQSFVYLVKQCREEHTSRWLEVRTKILNKNASQLNVYLVEVMINPVEEYITCTH